MIEDPCEKEFELGPIVEIPSEWNDALKDLRDAMTRKKISDMSPEKLNKLLSLHRIGSPLTFADMEGLLLDFIDGDNFSLSYDQRYETLKAFCDAYLEEIELCQDEICRRGKS